MEIELFHKRNVLFSFIYSVNQSLAFGNLIYLLDLKLEGHKCVVWNYELGLMQVQSELTAFLKQTL